MRHQRFVEGCAGSAVARGLYVTALVALAATSVAQMKEKPRTFALIDNSQDQVERRVLPQISRDRLLVEDRTRGKDQQRPGPLRFAVGADTLFSLTNSGTWQTLDDGRLWRLRIQSPGATSLSLGITRFEMPEGAKLWIYDPQHTHVEGPYTARHSSHLGSLWTPIIEGEEIVVEVFVSTGVAQPVVEIGKVNQGYRSF